jgi:hypothetical protein
MATFEPTSRIVKTACAGYTYSPLSPPPGKT